MSFAYLAKLRQESEARRARYAAEVTPPETMPQILARQIHTCHKAILPEEKDEPCDPSDELIYDTMLNIAQKVTDLLKCMDNTDSLIKNLFEFANYTSEMHQIPQLRRIYNSGELLHRLHHLRGDHTEDLRSIVQILGHISQRLTNSRHVTRAEYKTLDNQLVKTIKKLDTDEPSIFCWSA